MAMSPSVKNSGLSIPLNFYFVFRFGFELMKKTKYTYSVKSTRKHITRFRRVQTISFFLVDQISAQLFTRKQCIMGKVPLEDCDAV